MRSALAAILLAVAGGCSPPRHSPANPPGTAVLDSDAPIGTATMEADGTIVLMLRAEGPGGEIGEGMTRYPPGHEDYEMVKRHLGGLTPGQSKPVPPFPEK